MTINVQWKFALKLTIGLQKYSVIWEQTYVKHEKSINDYRKKDISKQMAYDWVKKKRIIQAFTNRFIIWIFSPLASSFSTELLCLKDWNISSRYFVIL